MTQRKRTPRKVTPVKTPGAAPSASARTAPTEPPSRTRVAGVLEAELDDPLVGLSRTPTFPPGTPTQPPPPAAFDAVARERADPVVEMRDRRALGDYTGALQVAEQILGEDPTHAEALACAEACRDVLVKMYSARIGPMTRVPSVVVAKNQLRWLSLDHRAGFVLSHIDGTSSLEMILDVSGMAPRDCLRILYELVLQHVIAFK
jgi:hypothetical protein